MKSKNERNVDSTSTSKTIAPTAPNLWSRIHPWHERLVADRAFMFRVRTALAADENEASDAVLEYLRFAYLAWTAPSGATPSKPVDEVWHAHLLFTRSYEAFCRDTRGEHLHHEPGDGASDDERFQRAYLETLARYETEFGEPVGRWWPRPAMSGTTRPVQAVERSRGSRAAGALALAILGMVLSGFAGTVAGPAAALAMGVLTTIAAAFSLLDKEGPAHPTRRQGGRSGGTCSSGDGGFVPAGVGDACHDGGSPGDGGTSCGSGCGGGGCGGA